MPRQSISLTKPNDDWLKSQIESEEYTSKSELINDLIRQARGQQSQIDWIRQKLNAAEKSGFTDDRKNEILKIWLSTDKNYGDPVIRLNDFKFSDYIELIDLTKAYVSLNGTTGASSMQQVITQWTWCSKYDPLSSVKYKKDQNIAYPNPGTDFIKLKNNFFN